MIYWRLQPKVEAMQIWSFSLEISALELTVPPPHDALSLPLLVTDLKGQPEPRDDRLTPRVAPVAASARVFARELAAKNNNNNNNNGELIVRARAPAQISAAPVRAAWPSHAFAS